MPGCRWQLVGLTQQLECFLLSSVEALSILPLEEQLLHLLHGDEKGYFDCSYRNYHLLV